jgi:hypothetical protein
MKRIQYGELIVIVRFGEFLFDVVGYDEQENVTRLPTEV